MSFFTWWHGATLGTMVDTWLNGRFVGEDEQGNRYYEERRLPDGKKQRRRWVIYNGPVEASRVPADWHAWLHHTVEEPPTVNPPKRQSWEKDHQANPTGSPDAYRPPGSLTRDGTRKPANGDYEPWQPDA